MAAAGAGRTETDGSTRRPVLYPWPLAPFNRQHPVRGALGDPRIGADGGSSFHTGIDIAAADGTPVFAVVPGKVSLGGPQNVVVSTSTRNFGYWHIVPAVRAGAHVPQHGLLGHVAPGWGHVHLAERTTAPGPNGSYWNPLRPGALTPYEDYGAPVVGRIVAPAVLSGLVELVAEALDRPPLPPPPPWQRTPIGPALVRWRLLQGGGTVIGWRTVCDFRRRFQPHVAAGTDRRFTTVYAPGTRQNHAGRPGLFRYRLARRLDTRRHPDGSYLIEVEATDVRGNTGSRRLRVTIANGL